MADIGRIQNNPIPWPTSAHTIKPTGEQQRQPNKQYKQDQEQHKRDDEDDGKPHIDEYA